MQTITLSPGLNATVKNLKEASARTELHPETELPAVNGLSEAERKHIWIAFKEKKEPTNAWY
ncbi:hypothetical protein D3C75_459060 [compost metagenome]